MFLSRNCLFERINSLQCYELTIEYNHLLLYIDFTIDLCCAPWAGLSRFSYITQIGHFCHFCTKLASRCLMLILIKLC